MNVRTAIRQLMGERRVNGSDMARALGITKVSVSHALTAGGSNVSVAKVLRMLAVLDCKLVIMPNAKRTPEGCIEVTGGNDDEDR